MGYEKEIILFKNAKSRELTALQFIDVIRSTEWIVTLSIEGINSLDRHNKQN
jgi:hypothetical protein